MNEFHLIAGEHAQPSDSSSRTNQTEIRQKRQGQPVPPHQTCVCLTLTARAAPGGAAAPETPRRGNAKPGDISTRNPTPDPHPGILRIDAHLTKISLKHQGIPTTLPPSPSPDITSECHTNNVCSAKKEEIMHTSVRTFLLLAFVMSANAAPPKLETPEASWERSLFKSINSLSKKVNWKPLRGMDLGADAMEVRVWTGAGLMPLQCKRIQRVGQKWTGYLVIDGSGDKKLIYNHEFPLGPEWEAEWKKIKELGILTLPDSSTLPDKVGVLDGVVFIVEINDGSHYRTYMYGNPSLQKWPEAKKIMEIVSTLSLALTCADGEKMAAEIAGSSRGPSGMQKAEQAGADQPATKPADKPPVKDQPSTPTPKAGTR